MEKYSINDFKKGDPVHHLSNHKLIMVVININKDENNVLCRWVDNNGHKQHASFLPEELGKSSDLDININKTFIRI